MVHRSGSSLAPFLFMEVMIDGFYWKGKVLHWKGSLNRFANGIELSYLLGRYLKVARLIQVGS